MVTASNLLQLHFSLSLFLCGCGACAIFSPRFPPHRKRAAKLSRTICIATGAFSILHIGIRAAGVEPLREAPIFFICEIARFRTFATFLFCFVGKISARPLPIIGAADGSSSDR